MEKGATVQDLTLRLENVPGALASAAEALGGAGVNIEGGFALSDGPGFVAHVLVEDAAMARRVLEERGISVEAERDVITTYVSESDRPGTLGRHARRIEQAGINIELMCLATRSRLVFATEDNAGARAALKGLVGANPRPPEETPGI